MSDKYSDDGLIENEPQNQQYEQKNKNGVGFINDNQIQNGKFQNILLDKYNFDSKNYPQYDKQQIETQSIDEKKDIDKQTNLEKQSKKGVNSSIIENEYLNEKYENNSSNICLQQNIYHLLNIADESEKVLNHLMKLSQQNNDLQRANDIIDALYYEHKLRTNDCLQEVNKAIIKNEIITDNQQTMISKTNKINLYKQNLIYQLNKLKTRQTGQIKKQKKKKNHQMAFLYDHNSVYDCVVDISLLTHLSDKGSGWRVHFKEGLNIEHNYINMKNIQLTQNQQQDSNHSSQKPIAQYNNIIQDQQQNQQSSDVKTNPASNNNDWEGAIVAVVGLYDKGKTFVLNNLTQQQLPSGKKVNTKGLSFKQVDMDLGTKLILLDTVGSYSPVRVISELSVIEKEATELFILDLVFEISDYFICVVNDFTSLDQRYLDRLSRSLQNSPNKMFREIIVIHNLKEVDNIEILDYLWKTQVTQIYGTGNIQRTKVAANNPVTGQLQEKHVIWFKTSYSRHVLLANQDSKAGKKLNPWTFSLLRYWLKAVFIPVNRQFLVLDSVLNYSQIKLSSYFKQQLELNIEDTEQPHIKRITTQQSLSQVRIPQVSIDSSGFITTKPDDFVPQVDIIKGEQY